MPHGTRGMEGRGNGDHDRNQLHRSLHLHILAVECTFGKFRSFSRTQRRDALEAGMSSLCEPVARDAAMKKAPATFFPPNLNNRGNQACTASGGFFVSRRSWVVLRSIPLATKPIECSSIIQMFSDTGAGTARSRSSEYDIRFASGYFAGQPAIRNFGWRGGGIFVEYSLINW